MYWSDINLSACHMPALVLSLENKPVEPVSQSVCSQTALWIMRKCSELSSVVVTALYPWSPWNSLISLGRWFLFILWIKPRALCSHAKARVVCIFRLGSGHPRLHRSQAFPCISTTYVSFGIVPVTAMCCQALLGHELSYGEVFVVLFLGAITQKGAVKWLSECHQLNSWTR